MFLYELENGDIVNLDQALIIERLWYGTKEADPFRVTLRGGRTRMMSQDDIDKLHEMKWIRMQKKPKGGLDRRETSLRSGHVISTGERRNH